jgi:hypothetical protein
VKPHYCIEQLQACCLGPQLRLLACKKSFHHAS